MSRALPKYNKGRVAFIGGAAAVVLSGAVIATTALAGEPSKAGNSQGAQTFAAANPGTITCPDVKSQLPANIPASAQAEVDRNLALLNTQIQEANTRLQNTVGQGGPNFVQNAILGPLADKRKSTVDRIATAIGRKGTKPQGLDALATCTLNKGGAGNAAGAAGNAANNGNMGNAGNAANNGNAGNAGKNNGNMGGNARKNNGNMGGKANNNGNNNAGNAAGASAAGTITCPDVKSQLPANIPASAQAEVDRNLALLNTQIQEANTRLQNTVGQGGPNFVQNAILGPLADKRKSTVDRIATAIGRKGTKPQGLDALATCTLNK
ncbi:hypothetical protein RKE30_28525 [Streptomyces sp. Li-HN-5-11]|uniref:hypothetical protein n=1 Tax=Streptomyces sp. Li-HN-5-11 TaxID=3075432 RepID=UPI0028AA3942|nr:hypothetical protein [Streptomyces sp. Li-HN-5-11]WNM34035.1 hypothetical protein RKE30_28525 [Streptomyces sp. Li-HN-5-11]